MRKAYCPQCGSYEVYTEIITTNVHQIRMEDVSSDLDMNSNENTDKYRIDPWSLSLFLKKEVKYEVIDCYLGYAKCLKCNWVSEGGYGYFFDELDWREV